MKRINIALCSLMLLGILFSCSKASLNYTQNGNWVSRAPFSGVPSGLAASFVIDTCAYVGTGVNPLDPTNRLTAFFKYTASAIPPGPTGYDSAYGGWKQLAAYGGGPRSNATGFACNGFGYIACGTPDGFTPKSDVWKYNPTANSWSQVDSVSAVNPTTSQIVNYPRVDAVAFSFDTCAYILTGTDYNYYFGDIWKYSPTANTWTQLVNFPGSPRSRALTWIYNGTGYLVTGYSPGGQWTAGGGTACYDFWKFNPAKDATPDAWTRLRDIYNTNPGTYDDGYTNIVRTRAAGFVIKGTATGDKGYITLGSNGQMYNYTWEYDFVTDLWTEKTPYEGAAREGAVGFTIQNRGFVATGINGNAAYNDCREFFPNQIYNQYD